MRRKHASRGWPAGKWMSVYVHVRTSTWCPVCRHARSLRRQHGVGEIRVPADCPPGYLRGADGRCVINPDTRQAILDIYGRAVGNVNVRESDSNRWSRLMRRLAACARAWFTACTGNIR